MGYAVIFAGQGMQHPGMLPWLLVAEHMSATGKPLSELVANRSARFVCSDEINYKFPNPADVMAGVVEAFKSTAVKIDYTDGISIEFEKWRFSLRSSNTEPLLRLNIEAHAGSIKITQKLTEIGQLIRRLAAEHEAQRA